MSNLQNSQESNPLLFGVGSFILHEKHFDYFLNGPPAQSQTALQSPERNHLFANAIEDIGADSLKTIYHGSLQMVPEICPMELHSGGKQELPLLSMKSSHNSLIFFEQFQEDDEKEHKLVAQTSQLNLKSSIDNSREDDLYTSFAPKSRRSQSMISQRKGHLIKQVKLLVRQLKREVKYNEKIMADLFIQGENFKHCLKHAIIRPITDEKGHLSGLIVIKDQEEYKIRVINMGLNGYEPRMQLWDEPKQAWLQFQFKIRLLS